MKSKTEQFATREFLLNITFLIFINLLVKPFYIFGIDRTVQNTVEAGDYGLYFALFNFTYLFQIINDFGIQNFNNRNIAQYNQLLNKYFPHLLTLKGILGLLYLTSVFVFAFVVGYPLILFPLIGLIAFNWILNGLVLYLRSNISGLALYRTDSLLSVLDKLIMILVCGILLWTPGFREGFRIEWFVVAQTFSLILTALAAYAIVQKRLRPWRFTFSKPFLLSVLRNSYPFALVIFLMTAYTHIDGVMIERMLTDGKMEADYYASAYRLLDAANIIGFLFAGLLLPMFARMIKEKGETGSLVRFSLQMILAGAITLAMAIWFYQEFIMAALYDSGNAYSGRILGYLMISFVAMSGGYIYGTLLTANGNLMRMNVIFLAGVILNVALNLLLIPRQAALGAAIATCITQFLVLFAQILLACRELKLTFSPRLTLRIAGFSIFLFLFASLIPQQLAIPWIVKFGSVILTGMILAFALGMIHLGAIRRLMTGDR